MPETLDLREDEPHPVSCLAIHLELRADLVKDAIVGIDKALQIIAVVHCVAGNANPLAHRRTNRSDPNRPAVRRTAPIPAHVLPANGGATSTSAGSISSENPRATIPRRVRTENSARGAPPTQAPYSSEGAERKGL